MENLSIKKLQAGDEDALGELFTTLFPRVRLMAYKHSRLLGQVDVEDVVQEAILKIYSNLQKIDPQRFEADPRYFWQWCNLIVRNIVIHSARASKYSQTIEETPPEELPVLQPNVDSIELFKETMQLLPEGQRKIIALRLEGFSYEEIAQMLNEDRVNVRNIYYRALAKLKKLLFTNTEGPSEEVSK